MSMYNKIRCANNMHDCFAYNHGVCEALCEQCRDKNNKCKFYKTKEQNIKELKQCAEKLNISFEDYIKNIGIKI